MISSYQITLDAADLFQVLDALDSRAASYEFTARYLRGDEGDMQLIEECSDSEEAEAIARHFRDIQQSILNQMEAKKAAGPSSADTARTP